MYMCIYNVCVCTYTFIYMCVYMCIHIYIDEICTCVYTYIYIYIYVYTHISGEGNGNSLQYIYMCVCIYTYMKVLVAQLYPTLWNPMDSSPPVSSVHGILQARILERVDIPLNQGIFPTQGLNLCLPHLLPSEPPVKPYVCVCVCVCCVWQAWRLYSIL